VSQRIQVQELVEQKQKQQQEKQEEEREPHGRDRRKPGELIRLE